MLVPSFLLDLANLRTIYKQMMFTLAPVCVFIVYGMTYSDGTMLTRKLSINMTSYDHSDDVILKIGFIAPRIEQSSGVILRAAFMLGLEFIQRQDLLPGKVLSYTYGGSQCNDMVGMKVCALFCE